MDVHVVIKGILHPIDLPACIYDLSGAVVVEHKYGLVQKERPHYHCWLPGVPSVSWQKAMLREYYDEQFPPGHLTWETHANAYYCVKKHNDFADWLKYTFTNKVAAKCKSPSIVHWNRSDPRPDSPDVARSFDELIVPANIVAEVPEGSEAPITTATPGVSKSKKDPCYKRFYHYLLSENVKEPSLDEVLNYWFEWTQGNYELRNVSGPVRYAYWALNDKDVDIRKTFVHEMRRKLFSDV